MPKPWNHPEGFGLEATKMKILESQTSSDALTLSLSFPSFSSGLFFKILFDYSFLSFRQYEIHHWTIEKQKRARLSKRSRDPELFPGRCFLFSDLQCQWFKKKTTNSLKQIGCIQVMPLRTRHFDISAICYSITSDRHSIESTGIAGNNHHNWTLITIDLCMILIWNGDSLYPHLASLLLDHR